MAVRPIRAAWNADVFAAMTLSLRNALTAGLLAVLVIAVAVVGFASYLHTRYALENLGTQIITETSKRIEEGLLGTLETAESQSLIMESLLTRGLWQPEDHEGASLQAYAMLGGLEDLSYLSLGLESGKYWHVYRDDLGRISVVWLLPQPPGKRRLYEFFPGADGGHEVILDDPETDRPPPSERPYYIAAEKAGRAIWTESYVFLGTGEAIDIPGVSRATPVYAGAPGEMEVAGGNPRLLGVLTADFDLHALSRLLRTVQVGKSGLAFIVEERTDGSLCVIAHPDAVHPDPELRVELTEPSPSGEGRVTVRADGIADWRVPLVVKALSDAMAEAGTELFHIDSAGGEFMGGFRRLQGEGMPNWTICVLVPRAEIIGEVEAMARTVLKLAALGVLLVTLSGLIFSRRIALKLQTIAAETSEVARFNLAPHPAVDSRIAEIRRLGLAVEEMKAGLRSFQKYVPADLVRFMLESGEEARLGGSRKTITVYFSDIAGFTSISEKMEPESLVSILAEYLEAMTEEMLRAQGTVDKYIGDAIMAFWGAPRPAPEHALTACRTALRNQETLARLRRKWSAEAKPELKTRIGLNTGEAIVGNFGCESRLDYTAIGDTVNFASRLESLNKYYGTEILMTDATFQEVRDRVVSRPVDKVSVRGKQQGSVIHELLGLVGEVDAATVARAETSREAFLKYLDRRWEEAAEILNRNIEENPLDRAAVILRDRCMAYWKEPPAADWTGVFRAE